MKYSHKKERTNGTVMKRRLEFEIWKFYFKYDSGYCQRTIMLKIT